MNKKDFLKFLYDYEGAPDLSLAEELLRVKYRTLVDAIEELTLGKRVVKMTISGKTMEFGIVDLPQLKTMRDEVVSEMETMLDVESNRRCYRVRSSKGF